MPARRATEGAPSDVLVLGYHAISDAWDADTTVTVAQFRWQIEHLLGKGYAGVTLTEALSVPPAGKVLVVTFDDAHRSVGEVALPLLRSLGVPATVFVPTDYVGTGEPTGWSGFEQDASGPHASELVCMDWDGLRTAAEAGWEIGSHTCSHPRLPQLADEPLARELTESKRVIEDELQRPCTSFAYPYSDHDPRVVAATHAAGYAYATTIPVGGARPLPLRWPRVGVFRTDSERRFKLLTAPGTRRFLATATGNACADAVRVAKAARKRIA